MHTKFTDRLAAKITELQADGITDPAALADMIIVSGTVGDPDEHQSDLRSIMVWQDRITESLHDEFGVRTPDGTVSSTGSQLQWADGAETVHRRTTDWTALTRS